MGVNGIWASAPNDVYLMVYSGGSLFTGKMWHYNGSTWTDFTPKYVEAFPGQQIFHFQPYAVYGFGKNDVWIVGAKDTSDTSSLIKRGFVMHFNGSTWQGVSSPQMLGLLTVWGTSSTDLWTGGYKGALYHYTGSSWQEYSVGDTNFVEIISGFSSSEVYVSAFHHNNSTAKDYNSIHQWNGLTWTSIESTSQRAFDIPIALADGAIYSTFGNIVVRRTAPNLWQPMFQVADASFWWIWASSGANIFAIGGGHGEIIYHYNGEDWYRFPQFVNPANTYYRMCGTNGEVFIAGEALSTNSPIYVLHGK